MQNRVSRFLYLPLAFLMGISMTYYVAGVAALYQEFFQSSKCARTPFDIEGDGHTIEKLRQEAKAAGLLAGDSVVSVGGEPYQGEAQILKIQQNQRPGDQLSLTVRAKGGQARAVHLTVGARDRPPFSTGEMVAFVTPILFVPLLGLLTAYWILIARPGDLNAWLVFPLLAFTESAFGNLDWSFWPAPWFWILGLWSGALQNMVFAALLWFGIYFPERWRVDRRLPAVKWIVLALTGVSFFIRLWVLYTQLYDAAAKPSLMALDQWNDRVTSAVWICCVAVFLAAMFNKLRTASNSDTKRRLRVLAAGSGLSFGTLLIILGLLPALGVDNKQRIWLIITVPAIALFPLTLAYVLVVQRAMDVQILLRMGTKYLLARASLLVLQLCVAAFLLLFFIVPMMQRKQHEWLNVVLLILLAAGVFRLFVMRDSLSSKLQRWLDRKFFREAYDSELVLSQLSDEARKLTEKTSLVDTVSRRISEVLHVPKIGIWLPVRDEFHLHHALGFDAMGLLTLAADSTTVQHLARTNRPARVYADRPEEWFQAVHAAERDVLRQSSTELLLALPGRENLMGLMTLGPKRSEEPYTPTDLRILQSVAAQTGLSLEVSGLIESLASEAAHREYIQREIEVASEVQQRLFPQVLPKTAGLSVAGMCRPALGVGGDYYDVFELGDGRLGIAIGDVSGKGISAALLMAGLRASLRGLTLDGTGDLARMMQKVNRLVYEASASHRYATFFFATFDPGKRELCFVNGGHNAPILKKAGTGEIQRLERGGMVVGLLPFAQYEAESIILERGDLLLAFTDGISEAMTAADEEWGEERMLAAAVEAANGSCGDVLNKIFSAADEFTAGAEQHDDMTVLVIKLDGTCD